MRNQIRKFLGIPIREVKPPEPLKHIDITKGCCQWCIEDGNIHSKEPEVYFTIGHISIHLCKEHFCELVKMFDDFYEKNREELEENDG